MTYSDVHKGDMLLLYVTFAIWVTREDDARHLLPLGGLSKTLLVTFVMTEVMCNIKTRHLCYR